MIKTVYLDVDGVLVDFIGGLHKALGVSYEYSNYPYKKSDWNILGHQIVLNDELVTYEQCNDCCDTLFWQNLEWMHDGRDILRTIWGIFNFKDIYLLTSPMPHAESSTGKWMWVDAWLPEYIKRTIITQAPKSLLAKPDTLLIDDKDENVEGFVKAGGYGILVNRPWNKGYERADHTVEDLEIDLLDIVYDIGVD